MNKDTRRVFDPDTGAMYDIKLEHWSDYKIPSDDSENKNYDTYKKIIQAKGVDHQLNMLKEELAELIVAISHYQRVRVPLSKVFEEIADVCIMLDQLPLILGVDEEVMQKEIVAFMEDKIDRLKDRL